MFKVLLAEDDDNLRKLIKKHLILNNFYVMDCKDGEEALDKFKLEYFDILLADIMMPKLDGNELVRQVKISKEDFPIIIMTALDSILDKKKSFSLGADDYITKPINYEELILRIEALLRRYKAVNEKNITYKSIIMDYNKKTFTLKDENCELTKKEFMVLYKMMSSPDRIFSRAQLLDEIWGYDNYSSERTIDVHLSKLREKIKTEDIELVGVRGLGYKVVLK